MLYCTDADLLHWQPDVFREAAWASHTLIGGANGALIDTSFTAGGAAFADAGVEPGCVLTIDGDAAISVPITAVAGATLTVSAISRTLDEAAPTPVAPRPTPGTLTYAVRTFWAQRRVASELIDAAAGVRADGTVRGRAGRILPSAPLRHVCALGTLQMIYTTLAAVSTEGQPEFDLRARLYHRLFRRHLRGTHVEIDFNNDGRADCRRSLGVIECVRA
jgi:hypothetical protein